MSPSANAGPEGGSPRAFCFRVKLGRRHIHMTPDDLLNVKRETAEVEQRGVRTGATRRSTSLVSIASPRATEPNTRTSRKPRWDAAARICPRIARRDPRSGGRSCCGGPGTMSPFSIHMLLMSSATSRNPRSGHRGASCQASQLAGTPVVQARILVASHASSQSGPSRRTPWYARPARQLLYVTRCGPTVSNIAPPTSVYNPVHGTPTTGIKIAGGAGGARTHDRRIMRSVASCIARASCRDTTEPCR